MATQQEVTPTAAPMVAASSALALVHYLQRHTEGDKTRLEQLLGLSLAQLDGPDQRVPAESYYRLWSYAEQLTGDPAVGLHAGETVDPESMGLVGHVFFNCDTLGDAISQYVRLHRLINETIALSFEQTEDQAILTWQPDSPDHYCRQDMDRTLASAITRTRHFIFPDFAVEWVELAHPRPEYADEYRRLFGGEVLFGATTTRVGFSSRHLSRPIPRRNPYVYSAVLKQVNTILARWQPQRSFSRKVRRLVAHQMATDRVNADSLAQQCHMSRQTLYRRLKREGVSFHELVEQVRKNKALRYVAGEQYSLGEIAFLLGFSELSAFSRAFKRWTGMAPAQFRAQHHHRDTRP
ncbi:MAG: AraC family transcriptional regulator [Marinobacter sp.]|uniref:AraC family transcriptional regulator n=1 Tax=Marinobacter sp. TaxID=50741 RepID=UPI00299E32AD|nr:AraC family transcriptional regulator [Marinobacter sp.]MDX1755162.1 AraC family transcriptional regulator [Marinobacter sp.]